MKINKITWKKQIKWDGIIPNIKIKSNKLCIITIQKKWIKKNWSREKILKKHFMKKKYKKAWHGVKVIQYDREKSKKKISKIVILDVEKWTEFYRIPVKWKLISYVKQ